MGAYFVFKGIDSRDYSIVVNTLPPIQSAKEDGEFLKVPGSDGYLFQPFGSLSPMEKELEITLKDVVQLTTIKSWLRGSGDLVLSSEPDVFYKARLTGPIDFKRLLYLRTAKIKFVCQPYGYLESGLILQTLTVPGGLVNPGTATSKPIITIFGTGSITLTVNSSNVILSNVSDYVTLNSEIEEAYKDLLGKNNDMQGEFPVFVLGNNSISWTGTVTKLEIVPNWRNL
ncbi:distal tail protein Dit [Youngiibacter fragilis]|uniref:Tail protein n=1 Tax=Youngiibacter fragilis 232.1 TaxID=994573 RepID=V7I5A1_9CLOT|nr:distal tail protein Dit [Youngiibacter fragilis]ETA80476.1 tail protein [Youngiibacter fragilis 232.1]